MRRIFALFWFCVAAQAQSQPQPQDSHVVQALLSEVHQLRVALERSNVIGPRIQLGVERLKLQQESVRRISDQLEAVRRDLERTTSDEARLGEGIKNMESDMNQATDPMERKKLADQLRDVKPHVEGQQKLQQSLRGREADLSNRLQSEQATLDGLNDRLSQIERALNATPVQ